MADSQEFPVRNRAIQQIARFWQKYGYYDVSYDQLLWAIGEHLKYGTIEVIKVKDDIVAFGRFNIDGLNALILDVVIRPDHRRKKLMKLMLLRGWKRFPFVKYIQFERGLKDKRTRRINMTKFLGVKNG